MLGVARGFVSGLKPPFDAFPMRMTSPREYVRNMARASGQAIGGEQSVRPRTDGSAERGAELA
jgi:hypothetical protein